MPPSPTPLRPGWAGGSEADHTPAPRLLPGWHTPCTLAHTYACTRAPPPPAGTCTESPEPWKVGGGREITMWGGRDQVPPWSRAGWAVRDRQLWVLGPGSLARSLDSLTSPCWAWLGPLCSLETPGAVTAAGGPAPPADDTPLSTGQRVAGSRDVVPRGRRAEESPGSPRLPAPRGFPPWGRSGVGSAREWAPLASPQSTLPLPRRRPSVVTPAYGRGDRGAGRGPVQGPPLGGGSC